MRFKVKNGNGKWWGGCDVRGRMRVTDNEEFAAVYSTNDPTLSDKLDSGRTFAEVLTKLRAVGGKLKVVA